MRRQRGGQLTGMHAAPMRTAVVILGLLVPLATTSSRSQSPTDDRQVIAPSVLVAGQAAFGTVVDAHFQPIPDVVVRVAGRRVRTDANGRFHVPTDGSPGRVVEVRLGGRRRAPMARATVVAETAGRTDGAHSTHLTQVPAYPSAGGLIEVAGTRLPVSHSDLRVEIGETSTLPLAGTPRGLTVQVPADIDPGRQAMRVTSNVGTSNSFEVQVIGLALEADDTDLVRGQGSRLRVRVTGTEDRVLLRVINRTPRVIRLEGGDEQSVETSGGVENHATVAYRGVGRGTWSIFVEAEPKLHLGSADPKAPSSTAAEGERASETDRRPSPSEDGDLPSPPDSSDGSVVTEQPAAPDSPPGPRRGRVLPDTGDLLVSGVPTRSTEAPSSEPDPRASTPAADPDCACRQCDLLGLDLVDLDRLERETYRTSDSLEVGARFRLRARAAVRCEEGCVGRVDGAWSLTFVPYVSSHTPIFLRRAPHRAAPPGTSRSPIEITGRGDTIDFAPTEPGTLIAHFRGHCVCGSVRCPEPVVASAEWRVGYPPLTQDRLEQLEQELAGALPPIGRGDGRPGLDEVADWFERTTDWRTGARYEQELELPEGAVGVSRIQVVGRGAANQRPGSIEGVLHSGDELRGLADVFNRVQTTWVHVEGEPGKLRLRYVAPVVDRFRFRIWTVDAEGREQRVDLTCPGTQRDGEPVRDACQAPASSDVRIAVVNVHPSRLEDVLLQELMARLAEGFGGTSQLSGRGPAWDVEGREAVFTHYLFRDVFLCAERLAPYLEGLARELGAEIEVHDHFIVIRGTDFGDRGLVPTWLGGRRPPGR